RVEEERDVEDVERGVDRSETDGAERRGLKRVEPHLAENGGLVSLRAAGVHGYRDAAVGRRLPLLAHLLDVLVPDGSFGNERGELDRRLRERDLWRYQDRERGDDECGRDAIHATCATHLTHATCLTHCASHGLARLAVHSPCPSPPNSAL